MYEGSVQFICITAKSYLVIFCYILPSGFDCIDWQMMLSIFSCAQKSYISSLEEYLSIQSLYSLKLEFIFIELQSFVIDPKHHSIIKEVICKYFLAF